MKNPSILKWINCALGLSIALQFLSGLIMAPANLHFLYELHNANAWVLLLLATLHLAHNWNWVKSQFPISRKELR